MNFKKAIITALFFNLSMMTVNLIIFFIGDNVRHLSVSSDILFCAIIIGIAVGLSLIDAYVMYFFREKYILSKTTGCLVGFLEVAMWLVWIPAYMGYEGVSIMPLLVAVLCSLIIFFLIVTLRKSGVWKKYIK
jgi:hypothetical protein